MGETIEVLSEEQLSKLDDSLKDNFSLVANEMGPSTLVSLNPLVTKLNDLQQYRDLKWDAEKKNDQAYKDAWGDIRSYRATVKETKSKLKKNVLEIGRTLDSIEKAFVEKATDVMDVLEENFRPYLEERERKKKEAEDKKEAARQAEVVAAKQDADKEMMKAKKLNAFGAVKYDTIMAYKEDMLQAISTWNAETILQYASAEIKTLHWVCSNRDTQVELSLLEDDQYMQMEALWQKTKKEIIQVCDNALESLAKKAEAPTPPPVPSTPVSDSVEAKYFNHLSLELLFDPPISLYSVNKVCQKIESLGYTVSSTDAFNQ